MEDKAYIGIVRWPKGLTEAEQAELLVNALGMEPFIAAMHVAQQMPQVVARVEVGIARDIVQCFRSRGVQALGISRAFLERQPLPPLVRRLVPAAGSPEPMYMVDFWHGEPSGLRARDITLIVRGTLDRSTMVDEVGGDRFLEAGAGRSLVCAPNMIDMSRVKHSTDRAFTEMIDLYLRDGSCLRLNGDHLSFDVLGAGRGLTDRDNADRLALRLAAEAPGAEVNTEFHRLHAPADLCRDIISVSNKRIKHQRDRTGMFNFYSMWMHAMVLGRDAESLVL